MPAHSEPVVGRPCAQQQLAGCLGLGVKAPVAAENPLHLPALAQGKLQPVPAGPSEGTAPGHGWRTALGSHNCFGSSLTP